MAEECFKIKIGIINEHCWINNTWLAPYCGYTAGVFYFRNGTKKLWLDGRFTDVTGEFYASNGWKYKIENLLRTPK